MTTLNLIFTLFSTANAIILEHDPTQYDQRPTQYVDINQVAKETRNFPLGYIFGGPKQAQCNINICRIGVPIHGAEMLTNGTHWFTTEGYDDWMVALYNKGLLVIMDDEVHRAIPENFESVDNRTERYSTLLFEDGIRFTESVTLDQFVIGLNDTLYRHQNDGLVEVGSAGFMRLISGSSKPDLDLSSLKSLSAPLCRRDGISLPEDVACVRLTQGKNRTWTIAFGSDRSSVSDVSCDYFISGVRDVHIDIPNRKRKWQICGWKDLRGFLSGLSKYLHFF